MTLPNRSGYWATLIFAAAILSLIAWADYATSYEIAFGPLYGVPVALVTWRINFRFGLLFCFLGAGAWLLVDKLSGPIYRNPWHEWERAGAVLVNLLFVGLCFRFFKKVLHFERAQRKQLEGVLPICARCRRIQDSEGIWVDLAAYLKDHTGADPRPKLCPDCSRQQYVARTATGPL